MFQSRSTLHTTSDTWVSAGGTDSTANPTIRTVNLEQARSAVFYATADVTTPAAGAFTIANATEIATKSTHGFKTGMVVQVSNSGGALPTGLAASTNYYIHRLSANTFYFCSSYANALAGTPVTVSDDGSGTNTVTPTTFAATLKLQGSFDGGTTWVDIPTETRTISADGTEVWEIDTIRYQDYRIYPNVTAGFTTLSAVVQAKGGD